MVLRLYLATHICFLYPQPPRSVAVFFNHLYIDLVPGLTVASFVTALTVVHVRSGDWMLGPHAWSGQNEKIV